MDISAIANLLKEGDEQAHPPQPAAKPAFTPADIGPPKPPDAVVGQKNSKKAIWDVSEVPEDDLQDDPLDTRKAPRYEIYYKQQVGTEDMFLGTGDKTPSSNDCTHIIVKIHFPGCKLQDLDLDVRKRKIRAESATLKLSTYLPLPVDHDKGDAKFDSKKELLIVTLPILLDEL